MMATRTLAAAVLSLCLFAVVALCSCSGSSDLEGSYVALSEGREVVLDLGPGGKGTWGTEEEEIPFTWERRGAEVWLHTKSGGLVAGHVQQDGTVNMEVPGVGEFSFVRASR